MPKLRDEIAWSDWSATAFARAADEDRPVLLALGTAWCEACSQLERAGYGDPDVVRIVQDRFVPVRVDADRRPDIAERYGLGGWPTTLCLTPEGEVLAGGVLLDGASVLSLLSEVADSFVLRRPAIALEARQAVARRTAARDTARQTVGVTDDLSPVQWFEGQVLEAFDPRHGGFGNAPKMPHLGALTFALRRHRETGDTRLRDVVIQSLDAMVSQGLMDPIEGGFYRYSESPDWTQPHSEKLLEHNADALQLYLLAWQTFEQDTYREVVDATCRYVLTTLWSQDQNSFCNSQQADGRYHCLDSLEKRGAAPAPRVDSYVYVSSDARMVSALLDLGHATGDSTVASTARDALDQLLLLAYEPGHGVAHFVERDPTVRGLLVDQLRAATAALDAHDVTGDDVYPDLAQEMMLFVLRTMWDERSGGFFDRAPCGPEVDVGLLREPVISVELNGEAACVLLRLARMTSRDEFRDRALEAIQACRSLYRPYGLLAAPYAQAVADAAGV